MANAEHVALVRKGAKAIAKWREAHPDERLDLSGADLSGADLHEAYLHEADLWEANLNGANLSGAHLFATNLSGAILTGAMLGAADLTMANLSRADLSGANLFRAHLLVADLSGANLTGAVLGLASLNGTNLREANLSKAEFALTTLDGVRLSGANLSDAHFWNTILSNVDLSQARGLETAQHAKPSGIGLDTLVRSMRGAGGKLTPELTAFFRGAGVPKELLDAIPKIVSEIRYYSCFISYGQPDLKFAEKLREDLKGRGIDCWLYEKDKTVGKRAGHEIVIERRGADKMVVVCSAKALVRDRFLEEVEDQINEDPDKMVPISLDDLWKEPGFRVMRGTHDLKPSLLDRNYADFANKPYDEALAELLKGLRIEKPAD
jgi:hypothetical protein